MGAGSIRAGCQGLGGRDDGIDDEAKVAFHAGRLDFFDDAGRKDISGVRGWISACRLNQRGRR